MEIALFVIGVVLVVLFTDAGLPLFVAWGLFKTRNLPDPPKVKNARPVNYKRKIEDEMDYMLVADKRRREQQQQQQMQQQQYQQQMYQQQIDQQMQQQMSMGGFGF